MGMRAHKIILILLTSLALLISICFSTPAFAKSKNAFVPRNNMDFSRLESGQYTVEVLLNGEGPYVFMIDTAATRSSIFEKTLAKLPVQEHSAKEALISGMTGTRLRPTTTLKSISFGKSIFENHSVIVLEDWDDMLEPLDGILGLEILKKFAISFSHGNNRLRIRDKFNPRAIKYSGWNKINLISNPYPVEDYGLKFTGAKIGRNVIPALIDTGANFTTLSWNSVDGTRLEKEKKRLREQWVVQGAVGEFKPRIVVKLDKIIIGGVQLFKHELLLMDFEELQVNGKGQYPLVIAGVDLMGGRDFVLDFKNNVVYLEPSDRGWYVGGNASRLLDQYE
ncbi:MAG: hypothetical protein EX271_02100 [Acidimicrobiales bacterium]|nr:hypothetical protein [Hyphomonadaceae bacterium]RZV44292.1 MAG: hypothetical protein EX271_02100 [Acidimicrobiales bacterium]